MDIPKGAVEKEKEIIVKKVLGELPKCKSNLANQLQEAIQIGTAYDFGPDGVTFNKPVTISLRYNENELPKEISESHLILAYFDGEKYVRIPAIQDKNNNSFTAEVNGFPGSLIVAVGVPIVIAGVGYLIYSGTHKKVYQLVWDPITKDWMHKMVTPENKVVKSFSKRMRVKDDNNLIDFDDEQKLDEFLQKKTNKNESIPVGFSGKYNDKEFADLQTRYKSETDFVSYPEDYLNKVDDKGKLGDCIDVTNVFVSMLREKGYQAKGVSGYAKDDKNEFTQPHAWAEVVIGSTVYIIDESVKLEKREEFIKRGIIKYPDEGDTYGKMWDEKKTENYRKDWYNAKIKINRSSGKIVAQDGMAYIFDLTTLGIPQDALFQWNFNNIYKTTKSRQQTFERKFEATGNYTLQVTAFWNDKQLSSSISFQVVGSDELIIAKPAVFITTRQVIGPPGATFDLTAKASPKDIYKFKWYIQGMSNSYSYQGEESTFNPVAKKLGKYNVNVKIYNLKNEFLSEDNATIYVEEDKKTKELTGIEGGKVKKVIYDCDTYYYGCNVGPAGTKMFENSVKEMEKIINDFIKQGRSKDAAKATKNLAKMKADFQLEKDTTSCNCQRKRTPTIIYE